MKNLLILERSVSEATFEKTNDGQYILEGIFSEIGKKNKNNRIYDENEFIPHVEELAKKVSERKILGELDHPKQFEVSLKNVSHIIEEISYDKNTKEVRGRIKLLDTDAGKQAKALVDAGVPIHISSRAAGVVEGNGHVKVKRLFTYDLVADPGFENAQLSRVNESFGLDNDDNIQIFEMNGQEIPSGITVEAPETEINKSKTDTQMNESKDESFVSLKDFDTYSNYIKEQFMKINDKISSINESSDTTSDDKKELVAYVESIAKELNSLSKKFTTLDENVDNLIAHNDYLVEGLEKVKDYAEMVALKTDQGIEYTKTVAEATDNSIEYTKKIVEEVDQRFDYQETINEAVDGLISHNDYIVENMEGIANFTEYLKENVETLGSYTKKIVEDINENFDQINEGSVEIKSTETINESTSIENDNKVEQKVVESNDEWMKTQSEKINNLLESAKKQKAVEEDKNLHFLHFVDESRRNEFESLDEGLRSDLINAFNTNKYFGTRDVERIWENTVTPVAPTLNWLENMPKKYKESYEALTESAKAEIKLQASVLNLDSQYKIDHFWSTRDLRSEKINSVNESTETPINESKTEEDSPYMQAVKAGLSRRFKL